MIDFDKTELLRTSWKRDLVVVLVWLVWLLFMSAMQMPRFLSITALSFVLIYAAWAWSFGRASFWFLVVSLLFASISLIPSGLMWLSLTVVYLGLRIARHRFLLEHGPQLALAIFFTSLSLSLVQALILGFVNEHSIWSVRLGFELFSLAVVEGILASMLFRPIKLIQAIR